MNGELNKKETRTVYDEKVVRLQLDIPYDEIEDAEEGDQDLLQWLDANVDSEVHFSIGPFEDDDQEVLVSDGLVEEQNQPEPAMDEMETQVDGQGDHMPADPTYDQ